VAAVQRQSHAIDTNNGDGALNSDTNECKRFVGNLMAVDHLGETCLDGRLIVGLYLTRE
jgi:hypothetical protein